MSRIANNPITIPEKIEINISGNTVNVKGKNGELSHTVHSQVNVIQEDNVLKIYAVGNSKTAKALSGTTRAVMQNIVTGVFKMTSR